MSFADKIGRILRAVENEKRDPPPGSCPAGVGCGGRYCKNCLGADRMKTPVFYSSRPEYFTLKEGTRLARCSRG